MSIFPAHFDYGSGTGGVAGRRARRSHRAAGLGWRDPAETPEEDATYGNRSGPPPPIDNSRPHAPGPGRTAPRLPSGFGRLGHRRCSIADRAAWGRRNEVLTANGLGGRGRAGVGEGW